MPLSRGLPETVLAEPPADAVNTLEEARQLPPDERRAATVAVAARYPRFLAAWADLAGLSDQPVAAYAYARVGYHRGLDAARAAGWRGSGYIRWREPANRGFLASLDALRRAASAIGEDDESERCELFLRQLDPDWRPGG